VRHIGLDVGQDACEVAIAEDGVVRSAGRIKTSRAELELFAQSLAPDDEVASEAGSTASKRSATANASSPPRPNAPTKRLVADWQQTRPKGAGAAPGRASQGPSGGQAARQAPAPEPAL
jgi:hypothetical protein